MLFTRDSARNDVTLAVQAAGSFLGPWTAVATSTLVRVNLERESKRLGLA